METMGTLRRTNYCGEVSLANAGQEMTVCGSIARARDKGGIIFADLRDTTGILQLVFDEDTPKDVFAKAESLKSEYVVIDQVGHFVAFRQDEILGFRQVFRLFGAREKDTGRMLGFVTGGGAA